MKKIASLAAAAALALTASLSMATPSSADDAGAAFAGGVLGFMAGAAAASGGFVYNDARDFGPWRGYGPRWGFRGDFEWRRHVRACFRAYGEDYDPGTDSYQGRYGRWYRCRL